MDEAKITLPNQNHIICFHLSTLFPDTVQDSDQATTTDILNTNTLSHTGGQGGHVLSWD